MRTRKKGEVEKKRNCYINQGCGGWVALGFDEPLMVWTVCQSRIDVGVEERQSK